ncbi:sensor histidine kinase [Fibrella arboris]|uniref:sensor histidine kinase n=1 Tax=Fibrella arboris TaxID=3242486 RepID=UPI0035230993
MRTVFILFWLLLPLRSWADPPVLRPGAGFRSSDLAGYLARFDTSRAVSAQGLATVPFRPVAEAVVNYGGDQRHHYLRFRVGNATATPQPYILHLQQHFFDTAQVWVYAATGHLLSEQISGWQMPVAQRPLPDRLHAFRVVVPPRQVVWVVLHTKVNPRQGVSKALLRFYAERAFIQTNSSELFFQSGLFGCLALVCLLGIFLFAYTSERFYGFYSLYILALGTYVLNIYGQFGTFIADPGWLADPGVGYSMLLAMLVFQGLFYLRYLRVDRLGATYLHRWGVGLCLVLAILAVGAALIPQNPWVRRLSGWGGPLYVLTMLVCLGWGLYKRRMEAYWLTVALVPLLLLLLYYVLAGWWLPVYLVAYTNVVIAPVLAFEAVVLAAALAYRFNADRQRALLQLGQLERESSRQVVLAQEEERQRLARDLHDDLGATLGLLRHELAGLHTQPSPLQTGQLASSITLITKSIDDLRLIAHHLMPDQFARLGLRQTLAEAVNWLTQTQSGGVLIQFVTYGSLHPLPLDVDINLYRIARELLNNALKHARPQRVVVQLIYHPDHLYLSVEDDGIGYSVSSVTQPPTAASGIGLKNMRRRADYIGALLTTESGPLGTLTTVTLPYANPPADTHPRAGS